jgi:hypothetical protein
MVSKRRYANIGFGRSPDSGSAKGLRRFLSPDQQDAWIEDETTLPDTDDRSESLEQRFKYTARFEKLLRRPQAQDVLDILRLYATTCIPIPRRTERHYWSVSCLPSTSDKPLVRVNASWMELFTLLPDNPSPLVGEDEGGGPAASAAEEIPLLAEQSVEAVCSAPPPNPPSAGIPRAHEDPRSLEARSAHKGTGLKAQAGLRARFILHLSDFTTNGSPEPDDLDHALLESCVDRPEACPEQSRRDVSHFLWKADTFGVKVRGAASIRKFLGHPRALRAIRRFNLTHMNRGRNAYQASHCYSLADCMLD